MNNKLTIKQYIINDTNFQDWASSELSKIFKKHKLVGYIFTKIVKNTKTSKTGNILDAKVLNVYLTEKTYLGDSIEIEQLAKDWELFLLNETYNISDPVFINPPLDLWIATKQEWCCKVAVSLSKQFNRSFRDMLSVVYYTVVSLYAKKRVYMGNLNYVFKNSYLRVLMEIRAEKRRLTQLSGRLVSLQSEITNKGMDENLMLEDIIPAPEVQDEEDFEYKDLVKRIVNLLKQSFSDREIDQIISKEGKQELLPRQLYIKLLKWRQKHSSKEVTE